MKLKNKLLQDQHDNLKSQLDTMRKKLEFKEQQDVAIQVDLVCTIFSVLGNYRYMFMLNWDMQWLTSVTMCIKTHGSKLCDNETSWYSNI